MDPNSIDLYIYVKCAYPPADSGITLQKHFIEKGTVPVRYLGRGKYVTPKKSIDLGKLHEFNPDYCWVDECSDAEGEYVLYD